jgi:serine/threonine protein kinase
MCPDMMTGSLQDDLPHALPPGTRLQQGRFVLGAVLGWGGFGITYHAQETPDSHSVAVKEFFPTGCVRSGPAVEFPASLGEAEQERIRQNFLNEARVLAALHHPGIVRVEATFMENDTAYMVMEFLTGQTLHQVVQEHGPLPEDVALSYLEQIGAALSEVHRTNFIHRDIKPENIMVCLDDPKSSGARVVLLDFGLNKELAAADTYHTLRLTNSLRFGSPGYSPPEQYGRQARFGPYTDIYALGATAYYLLSGQVPPEAPVRMAGEDVVPLCQLQPQISRQTSDAILWALELNGGARPQTLQEFLQAFTSKQAVGVDSPLRTVSATPPATSLTTVSVPSRSPISAPGPALAQPAGVGHRLRRFFGGASKRVLRHLYLGLLDILPRLILLAVLIAIWIVFARQQASQRASRQPTTQHPPAKAKPKKTQ